MDLQVSEVSVVDLQVPSGFTCTRVSGRFQRFLKVDLQFSEVSDNGLTCFRGVS